MQTTDNQRLAAGLRAASQAAQAGELKSAKQILAPLSRSFTGHPDLLQLMGQVAHLEGRNELALNLLGQAIANNDQVASYNYTLGIVLIATDQIHAAENALRRAIQLQPGMQGAQIKLGQVLRIKRQWKNARSILQEVLRSDPDNNDARYELVHVETDAGEFEAAFSLLEPLTHSERHAHAALDQLAFTHLSLGDLDKAAQSWRKSLKLQPDNGNAYRQLVNIRRCNDPNDKDIRSIQALLEDPSCAAENRIDLHLALAKMFDDLGDWARAFENASLGNALHHQSQPFRWEYHRQMLAANKRNYNQAWAADLDRSFTEARPVFIIGMPRSGTTLLERMLIALDQVATAGELSWFDLLAVQQASLEQHQLPQLRAEYLETLTARSGNACRIIDKMPNNFIHIGQILTLFPSARLIHIRRQPLDVCRSIYFQHFPVGQFYANDLEDLGDYFRDYRRLMSHWRKLAPASIIELEYEQLVLEPEKTLRTLLGRLELDWSEKCLAPHKSEGPVITASAAQIRQPINTHGIGRGTAYVEHFKSIAGRIGLDLA